jgi:hypothetical protein
MKKGESISMSVIIIAAIALLVLVVLAVLVLRASGGITEGTSCRGVGTCMEPYSDEQKCADGYSNDITKAGTRGGCAASEVCCIRTSTPVTE